MTATEIGKSAEASGLWRVEPSSKFRNLAGMEDEKCGSKRILEVPVFLFLLQSHSEQRPSINQEATEQFGFAFGFLFW